MTPRRRLPAPCTVVTPVRAEASRHSQYPTIADTRAFKKPNVPEVVQLDLLNSLATAAQAVSPSSPGRRQYPAGGGYPSIPSWMLMTPRRRLPAPCTVVTPVRAEASRHSQYPTSIQENERARIYATGPTGNQHRVLEASRDNQSTSLWVQSC
jgi:hypothetical protein